MEWLKDIIFGMLLITGGIALSGFFLFLATAFFSIIIDLGGEYFNWLKGLYKKISRKKK